MYIGPEVAIGPCYVEGEYVRDDITKGQNDFDLLLGVQLIDVNTLSQFLKVLLMFGIVTLLVYTLVFLKKTPLALLSVEVFGQLMMME